MKSSKILDDLVISATGAKAHYDVWWAQVSEAKPKYADVMNKHSNFFLASQDAHYKESFIYFAHLFDKRCDSSSISKYLESINNETEPFAFLKLQEDFDSLLLRAKPLLTIRHKRVAHIDAKLSESDVFFDLNITWNEIRQVIHDVATYVEKLKGIPNQGSGSIGIPSESRLSKATLQLFEMLSKS